MAGWWGRARVALTDAPSFRSWVVDANDGVIATAGVLEGFAGAGASDRTLIIAALSATIAGALSVGGAKWAEAAAEREAQLVLIAEEQAQLAISPDDEVAELAAYYERKGLTPEVAAQVAAQLSARDALAAQLESEHGIDEVMSRSAAAWIGIGALIAFSVGAAVPLTITALVPSEVESWVVLLAVAASLTLTSMLAARAGKLSLRHMLVRTLAVGVFTLGVSYLAGALLF